MSLYDSVTFLPLKLYTKYSFSSHLIQGSDISLLQCLVYVISRPMYFNTASINFNFKY